MDKQPLTVMHVLYRLGIGGLENGLVNLINRLPADLYRHIVVCLDGYDETFAQRLEHGRSEIVALHKREGQDLGTWKKIYRLLAERRPDVFHTRNFVALEYQLAAAWCRVPRRIHGEHGWDMHDLHGGNIKHRYVRRFVAPFVNRFITVSGDLARYLRRDVGLSPGKIEHICNGVDTVRFAPGEPRKEESVVIGTVGRMKAVKNQVALCRAFVNMLEARPDLVGRTRLRLVGDGPLRAQCADIINAAGRGTLVEFVGDSTEVAGELRKMDVFVLPSLAEGISNTVLEAMATGLPVVATAVGGNGELVEHGVTGTLVPSGDDAAMSAALMTYIDDTRLRLGHGDAGRRAALERFSIDGMVARYHSVYSQVGVRSEALRKIPSANSRG